MESETEFSIEETELEINELVFDNKCLCALHNNGRKIKTLLFTEDPMLNTDEVVQVKPIEEIKKSLLDTTKKKNNSYHGIDKHIWSAEESNKIKATVDMNSDFSNLSEKKQKSIYYDNHICDEAPILNSNLEKEDRQIEENNNLPVIMKNVFDTHGSKMQKEKTDKLDENKDSLCNRKEALNGILSIATENCNELHNLQSPKKDKTYSNAKNSAQTHIAKDIIVELVKLNSNINNLNSVKTILGESQVENKSSSPITVNNKIYRKGTIKEINKNVSITPNKMYECNQCDSTFFIRTELLKHVKLMHNSITKCKFCYKILSTRRNLTKHLKVCQMNMNNASDNQSKFECNECNTVFNKRYKIIEHLKIKHNETVTESVVNCNLCGTKFTRYRNMLHHQKFNCKMNNLTKKPIENEAKYTCDECQKTFKKLQFLAQHLKVAHMTKYTCNLCKKIYSMPSQLKRHQDYFCPMKKSTTNVKIIKCRALTPFICAYCKKEYLHKKSLTSHMQTHLGEIKKISCNLCDKTYTRHSNLTCHIQSVHLKVKPYICKYCNQKYSWKQKLIAHEKTCQNMKKVLDNKMND